MPATVQVKNTGRVAGKEVVQLYVSAPTTTLDKPAQELPAFGKTRLLQPGESQTLTFALHPADLTSYYPSQSAWVTDAGTYTLKVGASSRNIQQTATFRVAQPIVVEKDHAVLQPDVPLTELTGR